MAKVKYITVETAQCMVMDSIFLRKFNPVIRATQDMFMLYLEAEYREPAIWGMVNNDITGKTTLQQAYRDPSTENLSALFKVAKHLQSKSAPARELRGMGS